MKLLLKVKSFIKALLGRKVIRFTKALLGCDVFYRVQVKCLKEHHGEEKFQWVICPTRICDNCIIYSFGIGLNISFDLSLINKYGVNVYAFDPTPKSIQWIKSQTLPSEFKLFEFGIADYDGLAKFSPPENLEKPGVVSHTLLKGARTAPNAIELKVYKLQTILNMLSHDKIEILKLDIEGAEYQVIEDIIKSGIEVHQLLVEFHHFFENISISKTKNAVKLLNNYGYKIFYISPTGYEYSFLRMNN